MPRTATSSKKFTLPEGVTIVERQRAKALINDRSGQPVLLRQTEEVLLSDGKLVYGCAHCPFLSLTLHGVRPHLAAHKARPRPTTTSEGKSGLLREVENLISGLTAEASVELQAMRRKLAATERRLATVTAERNEARAELDALRRLIRKAA